MHCFKDAAILPNYVVLMYELSIVKETGVGGEQGSVEEKESSLKTTRAVGFSKVKSLESLNLDNQK